MGDAVAEIGWANLAGQGSRRFLTCGLGLRLELVDPLHARARDRLIGAHDHPAHPRGVVQRLQRDDHLDGRAVGVGDDPLVPGDVVRVDLGDDERDVGVHPEGARIVDDDRPGRSRRSGSTAARRRRACSRGRCRPRGTPPRRSARSGKSSPRNVTVFPALRSEARNLIDATGNARSSSRRIIRSPTAPLAPTTATCFTIELPYSAKDTISPDIGLTSETVQPGHSETSRDRHGFRSTQDLARECDRTIDHRRDA